MKTGSKILLLSSCILLLPQIVNAQGAAKGLQCVKFQSATVRNSGDEGSASAVVSTAGFVLTGGGCEMATIDGHGLPKPPAVYQSKPDGNRWLCRVHNGQGPIGPFTITAYAIGCQFG
ncbi:MAG TPA: hypothetical protein VNW15_10510 [Rhizomicrobium sp.]|nr:hypothetical protein [Rhizomicrobium sp.]